MPACATHWGFLEAPLCFSLFGENAREQDVESILWRYAARGIAGERHYQRLRGE
jgi:hypothetical protein